jgi:tripartite-type tricarboxylate transporter receptor subunit TctC
MSSEMLRRFFHDRRCGGGLLVAGLFMLPAAAPAADYPVRPVRIIVPNPPGGGPDISTRILTPMLAQQLGQQFVVDNRPGASGNIGAEAASRAAPDGYTLLAALGTLASNPAVMKHVPYDLERDFAPISLTVTVPLVLVGHTSLPPRTFGELVTFAKARPGQLTFASAGMGSISHLSMELLLSSAGIKMTHVPYKGIAQALLDLSSGEVYLSIINTLVAMRYVRDGRLKAFGVTSLKPTNAAPGVPTIAGSGVPGYEAAQWYGMLAPARTPPEIVYRLHGALVRSLEDPAVKKRFLADGAESTPSPTPDAFGKFISAEIVKWSKAAKGAGIKPE